MSRLRVGIAVIVVIVLATLGYLYFRSDSSPETATVERGSIDVTIDTVGTIQLRESYPIRTAVGGTIDALGAKVGDEVASGDIIVLLDQDELNELVEDAGQLLEGAEFQLQFAEQRLEEDEDSLELQLSVVEAQERVELARESLDEALEARSNGAILAENPGIVLEFFVEPGDRVGAQQPVAQLQSPGSLILVADIDELDLPNVQPGANVRFRLDAYPATEVEGTIVNTAPLAVQRGGATLFPAEVAFSAPADLDVRPGMNADVTVVTDLREDVLLVPERALTTVGQRAFVMVERDGGFEEVEVILGYRSAGMAEIVEGLEEGDRVQLR